MQKTKFLKSKLLNLIQKTSQIQQSHILMIIYVLHDLFFLYIWIIDAFIHQFRIMIQNCKETLSKFTQQIIQKFNQLNHPEQQNFNEQGHQEQIKIDDLMRSILIQMKNHSTLIQDLSTIGNEKQILEPFQYVLKNGGKRIRLVIAILINGLYSANLRPEVIQIGGMIQMLHTSSLIIDDIEDSSKSRRNKPCAHLVFGVQNSINSANLMYFLPIKKLLNTTLKQQQKNKLIQIYARQMITCHLGQAQDVWTHKINKKQDLPTLQEYIRMTSAKTSSLFTMLIEMIAVVLSINQRNIQVLTKIMGYVGISFQIKDDLLNITNTMGKNIIAQDFYQRKFTILIHHLRKNQKFMQMFFLRQKNPQIIQKMVQIVKQNRTIQFCSEIAYGYAQKALKQIDRLECPLSKASFKAIVKYIVQRNQ